MNIADIVETEYLEVDVGTRMGKVRAKFENDGRRGLVVTEDGDFSDVITERQVLQSHVEDDAKVKTLLKPSRSAPGLALTDGRTSEAARMLIEGNTKVAPVFDGEAFRGIITHDAILEAVFENLDAITVADIYTDEPITLEETDGIGRAINRLREHGISRLPVLNENDQLTGVVTTHDIADFVIREDSRTTTGDRSGDSDRMLDIPVYDIMSSPVETVAVTASVRAAVEQMLANDYGGLVVTPEENGRQIVGVVTKTDVLRALTFTEERHMDVQITNVSLLDSVSRETIVESIESVARKFADMQVMHAHVRFHEHKEKLRGTSLIACRIQLRTNKGQIGGSGEGYGAESAFRVALDKLERNVLEVKGVTSDEEYRGQLLRKLNEL